MKYWAGILCIVVVIGWIVAWSVWPFLEQQAAASVPASRNDVSTNSDAHITGMHLMAQLGEQAALQVTAQQAVFSGAKQRAVVYGVEASITQAVGRTWYVSAAQGIVDRSTGDLTVQGRVRLYEKDGYVIETDRLHLRTAERVLHTEEPVVMRGNAVSIAGTGLRHEIDENRIVLQHHVKASFRYAGGRRVVKAHDMPLGTHADAERDRFAGVAAAVRGPKSDTVAGD